MSKFAAASHRGPAAKSSVSLSTLDTGAPTLCLSFRAASARPFLYFAEGEHMTNERAEMALSAYIPADAPDRVALAGAPTTGEAGEHARAIAERLGDMRVAVAILLGAAEKADSLISSRPEFFGRLVPPSQARARAAAQPLRRIIDACAAFEDALAAAGEGAPPVEDSIDEGRLADEASIAAARAAGAILPDERTLAAIAVVSKTIAAVRPVAEAVAQVAPAFKAMPSLPMVAMPRLPPLPPLPRVAPPADAPPMLSADELAELERVGLGVSRAALGSPSPLSPAEEALFLRDPPPRPSAAEEAAFAAAARDFPKG